MGLRVGVGVGEAFAQAAPLYMTLWYKRDELATRAAIVFSTSAVSGCFNGLIAYGIQKNIDKALGVAAWKWIFIIEGMRTAPLKFGLLICSDEVGWLSGAISIAYAFVLYVLLPPVPEKVTWGFSAEQKEIAVRRSREAYNVIGAKIRPRQLFNLLKDPKTYFYGTYPTSSQQCRK